MANDDTFEDDKPTFDLRLTNLRWGMFGNPIVASSQDDLGTVHFVQTTLNLALDADQRFAQDLAPVREIIEPGQMEFQSLMQRDLDDYRVSHDLIPYLIRHDPGAYRMFPSILVALLPAKDRRLTDRYLPVSETNDAQGNTQFTSRDGQRIAWQLFLRKQDGRFRNEGARLELNRQWCRLAIIDGQHRAMALLALFRNKTSWPVEGRPFRHFYANYPEDTISTIQFDRINLPVTLCLFHHLHEKNQEAVKAGHRVVEAVRRLFLDVNKEARPPSKARQVLLDDREIVSDFVRAVMQGIQRMPSAGGMRLWNLYLDQIEDFESAMPVIAITSVMHLDNVIGLHLLGRDGTDVHVGFGDMSPSYRKNPTHMRELLGWRDIFGKEADGWRSNTVPRVQRTEIVKRYGETWGRALRMFLDRFRPFQALAVSAANYHDKLTQSGELEHALLKRMLFEGQGMRSVHQDFSDRFNSPDNFIEDLPEYSFSTEQQREFDRQMKLVSNAEATILREAALRFWCLDENTAPDEVERFSKTYKILLDRVFRTKAFQIGAYMAFVHIERVLGDDELRQQVWRLGFDEFFWSVLSVYFSPKDVLPKGQEKSSSKAYLTRLDGIVRGEKKEGDKESPSHRIQGFNLEARFQPGLYNLIREVLPGDLKEARWPRFKYLLLEAFTSQWPDVAAERDRFAAISSEHKKLLAEVQKKLDDTLKTYRKKLHIEILTHRREVFERQNNRSATTDEVATLDHAAIKLFSEALNHTTGAKPTLGPADYSEEGKAAEDMASDAPHGSSAPNTTPGAPNEGSPH